MHDEDYLIVDPTCEVNERCRRDKNDGNELIDDCDLPLDLELTERLEVDDETLPYTQEDWDCPEQTEVDTEWSLFFPSPWRHARAKGEGIKRNTTGMVKTLS